MMSRSIYMVLGAGVCLMGLMAIVVGFLSFASDPSFAVGDVVGGLLIIGLVIYINRASNTSRQRARSRSGPVGSTQQAPKDPRVVLESLLLTLDHAEGVLDARGVMHKLCVEKKGVPFRVTDKSGLTLAYVIPSHQFIRN